jgi:hypothetical protein
LQSCNPSSCCQGSSGVTPPADDNISTHSDSRPTCHNAIQNYRIPDEKIVSHQTTTSHTDTDSDDSSSLSLETHSQNKTKVTKENNMVIDGTHQYITPVTRSCY